MKSSSTSSGKFPLDDLDVAQNGRLGVAGEPADVAGTSDGTVLAPFLQHRAVFRDFVLTLLGREEIVGIYVLQTDKDTADTGLCGLFDEVRDAMAQGVHLDREADLQALADPQLDHSIEERFPMRIAGKIVRQAGAHKRPRQVDGPGELVRLNAN